MQVKIECDLAMKITLPRKDVEAAIAAIKATGLDIEIGGEQSDLDLAKRVRHVITNVERIPDGESFDYYAHCSCGAISQQFISKENADTWPCPLRVAAEVASQRRASYFEWKDGNR